MRLWLVRVLLTLLRWLEDADPKLTRTRALVMWADDLTAPMAARRGAPVTGERKRAQVLSRLMTEFPDARVRDLAYLIERVLQER